MIRVKNTDTAILSVIDIIRDSYRELSLAIDPVGNIFNVFFHDLVVHFSGILIHRASRDGDEGVVRFPYVSKNYALEPTAIGESILADRPDIYSLKERIKRKGICAVALGNSIPYGYGQHQIVSKAINLIAEYQGIVSAYLPKRSEQIWLLQETLIKLCLQLGGSPVRR